MADILKDKRDEDALLGIATGECVEATLSSSSTEKSFPIVTGYRELSITTRGDEDAELTILITLAGGNQINHCIFGCDSYNYVVPLVFERIETLYLEETSGRTIKIKANLASKKV